MSEETMNDESPSMAPPEDLPEVERYTPTPKSKPNANPPSNSKSRLYIGIAAGCLVVLCLCCAGVAGVFYFLPDQLTQVINVLGVVSTPTPARSGLPGIPGGVAPGQKPPLTGVAPGQKPPTTGVAPSSKPSAVAPATPQVQPTTGGGGVTLGNPFADAAAKAKTASKYRIESTMTVGSTTNGKYEEMQFMDMKGVVDGKNSQFEIKGGLFAMLASGGALETIQADGKSYIRGMAFMGMDPKQWYVQKDSSTTAGADEYAKPDFFNDFTKGAQAGEIKKIRSESLDGLQCDVYTYDIKSTQNAAMIGLLGSAKDKDDFSAIDKSEILTWLCSDGYVHKFTFDFQAHNAKDAKEKGAMKMSGHMWDFNNAAIKVTVPANAKPFPGQ